MENIKKEHSSIKRVIGILSGKGGVGKSTVTVMLADSLLNHGYKVGILDADITGSSIPSLLDIHEIQLSSEDDTIIPFVTEKGLKVVSMSLMVDDKNQPIIWRGSVLSNVIQNIWNKAKWGDIDYLLIDMPPRNADIVLFVLQQIHPDGIIMVSIPQDFVQTIVCKSIELVHQMNIKMIGTILNLSYITCPCCGEEFTLYQENKVSNSGQRILGHLPAKSNLAELSAAKGVLDEETEKLITPITRVILEEVKV
ncbi:MAG: Mrp/NBP35 family ATP-binding protein [Candidatus Cloacimonetes bacterium]|nr:Mrp/NBP35 family ATP-binding protein [Candidatus Cloacimonadota bacterium]